MHFQVLFINFCFRLGLRSILQLKKRGEAINVIDRIGHRFRDFGLLLLDDDDDGSILYLIELQNNWISYDIILAIIMRWIRGKGKQPVSWETLASVLEKIELRALAHDIREAVVDIEGEGICCCRSNKLDDIMYMYT